jgi:hypothetical protein
MEVGVAAIPPSAFYCDEHKPMASSFARFAFCKTDEAIVEAQVGGWVGGWVLAWVGGWWMGVCVGV